MSRHARRAARRARRLLTAGSAAAIALVVLAPAASASDLDARNGALDAAAAWRDVLDAHRAPAWPRPGETESVIVLLTAPPLARAPGGADTIAAQQDTVGAVVSDLKGSVTQTTRVVANALAVRLPAGGVEALARLPEVRAVVPVSFLAPAQAAGPREGGTPAGPVAEGRGTPPGRDSVHIALIDAGVDVTHPWLGGGMGPTFPVLGGIDHVDGDGDPRIDASAVRTEAHGTQMAGLVLRSRALADLPPGLRPRLIVHRVVAPEAVGGRMRPLARTDRVLAAIERAVDPNGDGRTDDRAEVILIGVAGSFGGDGVDPLVEAVASADRAGSAVIVPAGNDGPTLSRPGTVGALAASPDVLTVGGLARGVRARTARLDVRVGAAVASLDELPLLGGDPPRDALPVVVLRAAGALVSGDSAADYRGPDGRSRVEGTLVVVARGGGTLQEKAAMAAASGARALAVWDEAGPATFPVTAGDLDSRIPIIGLGRAQGSALADVTARPDATVTLSEKPVREIGAATVASFSSSGPTADGRQKPDLLAPAVAIEAPVPGRDTDGEPRNGLLTGTSAAAADVAARAARLRVDHPSLDGASVRALLIQGADRLPGAAATRQGAGEVAAGAEPVVRIDPPVAHAVARRGGDSAALRFALVDLTDSPGAYRVSVTDPAGREVTVASGLRVGPGGRRTVRAIVAPWSGEGTIVVRRGSSVVATGPVYEVRRPVVPRDALGVPRVRVSRGFAEVLVRVGHRRRADGRIVNSPLRSLRLQLVPASGGPPIAVLGSRQDGTWPAGTYRFMVAPRDADGVRVPRGLYRVRAIAVAPDGRELRTRSARFPLR
jgi:hypothetical protein